LSARGAARFHVCRAAQSISHALCAARRRKCLIPHEQRTIGTRHACYFLRVVTRRKILTARSTVLHSSRTFFETKE